jgi:hypothetical protein
VTSTDQQETTDPDDAGWLASWRARRSGAAHLEVDAYLVASGLLLLALVVHPPEGLHVVARVWLAVGLVVPALT